MADDLTDVQLDAIEEAVRRSPDTMLAIIDALRNERGRTGELEAALRELVTLKDGPRDADYERRKPAAWQRARDLLDRTAPLPTPTEERTVSARPVQTIRLEVEVNVPAEPLLDGDDLATLEQSLVEGVARLGWGVDVRVARL